MAQPLYKKFGTQALQPTQMQTGLDRQQANYDEIFGGLKDIYDAHLARATETNTRNMEAYLRDQIRSGGLAGEEPDTAAVASRFGSLIDMDRINTVATGEREKLITDATNKASVAASKFDDDPLKAKEEFVNVLRDQGAPESMVMSRLNDYSSVRENMDKMVEAQNARDQGLRNEGLFSAIREGGEEVALQAIEKQIFDLPAHKKNAERERLTRLWQKRREMTESQKQEMDFTLKENELAGQAKLGQYESRQNEIATDWEIAKRRGPSESSYANAKKYMSDLGSNVATAIGDKVDNPIEKWFKDSDSARITQLYRDLTTGEEAISADDANAILFEAFGGEYGGDGLVFNDLEDGDINAMAARAIELSEAILERDRKAVELAEARSQTAEAERLINKRHLDLSRALARAGSRKKLGVRDAMNIQEANVAFKDQLAAADDTGRVSANYGRGGPVPEPGTNTGNNTGGSDVPPNLADMSPEERADYFAEVGGGDGTEEPNPTTPESGDTGNDDTAAAEPISFGTGSRRSSRSGQSKSSVTFDEIIQNVLPEKATSGKSKVGSRSSAGAAAARRNLQEAARPADEPIRDGDIPAQPTSQPKATGEAGKKETSYYKSLVPEPDATKKSSPAYRHKNPGNIKFSEHVLAAAKELGIKPPTASGDFAKFASPEDGIRIMERMLFAGTWRPYKGKTLSEAIKNWSATNQEAYAGFVLDRIGTDKLLSEYTESEQQEIIKAMVDFEGYNSGKA